MNSYNITFKQVLSFFSNLTSVLLIPRIVLYTYLKFEETVSELVKTLIQAFSDTPNWIYKKHIKALQRPWTYPLFPQR